MAEAQAAQTNCDRGDAKGRETGVGSSYENCTATNTVYILRKRKDDLGGRIKIRRRSNRESLPGSSHWPQLRS